MSSDRNIRIIRVAAESVDMVAPLFDAYRVFYKKPCDLPAARGFLRERIQRDQSVIFLALMQVGQREIAAGFTQLYPVFSSVSLRPAWILNDLFVDAGHRRLGIARLLLQRAAEFAAGAGACYLELATALDNRPAQALYESLGWKRETDCCRYELTIDRDGP